MLVLRSFAKKITLTPEQTLRADVNRDNKVNATDALKILRYFAKKITSFD